MTRERILLIDLDSKIPNLALMKISAYWKSKGCEVGFSTIRPTRAYISCIFKKNRKKAESSAYFLSLAYPNIEIDIGGTGYDLKKTLPDDIERMRPDYDLYPECNYSLGFTSRGCIRACPFCVVPHKEGKLHRVSNIKEIYDPRFKAIKLMDNNVLGDMDNFREIIDFCRTHNLKLDLSQGLDARLLTKESAELLSQVRPMASWVFAFDSLSYKNDVLNALSLLKGAGINVRSIVQFYVYCDRSDGEYGLESAIERCRILKENGTNAYVMLNIDEEPTIQMKNLKRWANRKHIYWSINYEDYNIFH